MTIGALPFLANGERGLKHEVCGGGAPLWLGFR